MAILVTGGAGFIGSHTVVELINAKEQVVVVDNFSNSSPEIIDKIKEIVGCGFVFYEGSCCDKAFLEKIFCHHSVEAVIHFAALKAVGESVLNPLTYYYENLTSAMVLLQIMKKFDCSKFIFSSSATVYGNLNKAPFVETMPTESTNPYGETKIMIERILKDICFANSGFTAVSLRYFNPIGAHSSGLIGDLPRTDKPSNLMPYIVKVAGKKLSCLQIFGKDYDTKDGTGVRDYIHVVDLSLGHLSALQFCRKNSGFDVFNLGTGKGTTVLDVIRCFEQVSGVKLSTKFVSRRSGDVAVSFCDCNKAKIKLNWQAKLNLKDMCNDAWKFAQSLN